MLMQKSTDEDLTAKYLCIAAATYKYIKANEDWNNGLALQQSVEDFMKSYHGIEQMSKQNGYIKYMFQFCSMALE